MRPSTDNWRVDLVDGCLIKLYLKKFPSCFVRIADLSAAQTTMSFFQCMHFRVES